MRALIAYPGVNFSVTDVADKLGKGLATNGVEVCRFNTHHVLGFFSEVEVQRNGEHVKALSTADAVHLTLDHLKAELWRTMPDLLFIVSGFFVDHALLDFIRQHRPHKVIGILTEQPYESAREMGLAEHLDAAVLNDPANLDRFRDVCPNSFYLPHSFDPDLHHPNGRTDEFDFSFVGTGYPSRCEYLEKVDYGDARVCLAGNWEALEPESPLHAHLIDVPESCIDNADTADIYRRSAMSANLYRNEASDDHSTPGVAMGPREVELAACGTFFARDPRPEGDELFPMLPTITDPSELSDVIRWSMSHPVERQAAADAARAAVADRDCVSVAADLLRRLDA